MIKYLKSPSVCIKSLRKAWQHGFQGVSSPIRDSSCLCTAIMLKMHSKPFKNSLLELKEFGSPTPFLDYAMVCQWHLADLYLFETRPDVFKRVSFMYVAAVATGKHGRLYSVRDMWKVLKNTYSINLLWASLWRWRTWDIPWAGCRRVLVSFDC